MFPNYYLGMCYAKWDCGPAAYASPGSLLEMQIPGSISRPKESKAAF